MQDQFDLWMAHDRERRHMDYPICPECGEEITDEHGYLFDGDIYCKYCYLHGEIPADDEEIEMVFTENYMED